MGRGQGHTENTVMRRIPVALGTSVIFRDQRGHKMEVRIVSPLEADLSHGLLSSDSPVARALLGHVAGESTFCSTPSGLRELAILAVR